MWKFLTIALRSTLLVAPITIAPVSAQNNQGGDPTLAEMGERLYNDMCAACHMESGRGSFDFPALNRNPNLEDLKTVVAQIVRGTGAMPAFADLDAEEIAAITTHLRTAWNNDFGSVQVEEAAAVLEALPEEIETVSVWEGVYTEEQAAFGETVFRGRCADCHGVRGDGVDTDPDQPAGPPVAGSRFLANWEGQGLHTLFAYTRLRMPTINPGSLSDEEYAATVAFMLRNSDVPPGEEELPSTVSELEQFLIEAEPN